MPKQTKHEKEVELARASATKYGIYLDGTVSKRVLKSQTLLLEGLITLLSAPATEETKQKALALLLASTGGVNGAKIENVSLNM